VLESKLYFYSRAQIQTTELKVQGTGDKFCMALSSISVSVHIQGALWKGGIDAPAQLGYERRSQAQHAGYRLALLKIQRRPLHRMPRSGTLISLRLEAGFACLMWVAMY
jgi:hypothetical protein